MDLLTLLRLLCVDVWGVIVRQLNLSAKFFRAYFHDIFLSCTAKSFSISSADWFCLVLSLRNSLISQSQHVSKPVELTVLDGIQEDLEPGDISHASVSDASSSLPTLFKYFISTTCIFNFCLSESDFSH